MGTKIDWIFVPIKSVGTECYHRLHIRHVTVANVLSPANESVDLLETTTHDDTISATDQLPGSLWCCGYRSDESHL